MNQSRPGLQLDGDRLLGALRRWGALVLVAAIFAGAAAFAVSQATPREYEATAQLYVAPASNPTVSFQDVALGQTLAASYVELAKAEVVLQPALESVGWSGDLKSFRGRLSVVQVRNTSIISITFRSFDPKRAAETAGAVADSFIKQSRQLQVSLQGSTVAELDVQVNAIQGEIASLDSQIATLRADLAATPKPSTSPRSQTDLQNQINLLDSSRQSKQQTLASLLKTRDDMRLGQARADTTVSLWQPASVPSDPVLPRPLFNTFLGAVVGGLVALLGIAVLAYLDDRLTDLEQIRQRLGAPPLGQVRLHAHPETFTGKLFLRDEPTSPEAEAIRGIRTNILFASVDHRPRTLLVTSALPGEGKSVLSANLALAFAESGTPVVLVDADLRRPSQHRLFRVSASSGLTNLLTEAAPPADLQRFRVSPQVMVIPSGPLPPNPAEVLASGRMGKLLEYLSGLTENGIVILDSSPALAVADPVALSTKVDGCVLVVDSSRTRVASTTRALAALERVHAHIVGVVLNKLTAQEDSNYRYGDYYGDRPTARPKATTERV